MISIDYIGTLHNYTFDDRDLLNRGRAGIGKWLHNGVRYPLARTAATVNDAEQN